jgi:DNA-directed RNA polymerase sigma subunit (sigma70/sigma32)
VQEGSRSRGPSTAELARAHHLSPAMVRDTWARLPQALSLDRPVDEAFDRELGDLLDAGHATPEQLLARELLERLRQIEPGAVQQLHAPCQRDRLREQLTSLE